MDFPNASPAAGPSQDAFTVALARIAALEALPAPATTFVNGGASQTVAQLLANSPPTLAYRGLYARVSDLWGSVDEVMRCRWDGVSYNWVPQRSLDFHGSTAATSGVVNILPLVTPPVLDLTATLLGNITPTLSAANAYIGQTQIIRARGVLGLFGINLSGIVGGGTVPILTGADRTVVYTQAGWKA